jgi:hypothetical protein
MHSITSSVRSTIDRGIEGCRYHYFRIRRGRGIDCICEDAKCALGTNFRGSSNLFPTRVVLKKLAPVTLPPGRLRLATRPAPTGSPELPNTIGITPRRIAADGKQAAGDHRGDRHLAALAALANDRELSLPQPDRNLTATCHSGFSPIGGPSAGGLHFSIAFFVRPEARGWRLCVEERVLP